MTMKQFSPEVIPMNTGIQQSQSAVLGNQMSIFVADELLPMMLSLWPAGGKLLDSNITGNALAYGLMLRGLPVGVVRETLISLAASDPDRAYAPKPQELRKLCLSQLAPAPEKHTGFIVSMSALEMQVCVMCLSGKVAKTLSAVDSAIASLSAGVIAKGGVVDGKRGFSPLQSIIQNG